MKRTLIEQLGRVRHLFFKIAPHVHEQRHLAFAGIGFFIFVTLVSFIAPPRSFPTQSYIDIKQGTNLRDITAQLQEEHYIKSGQFFEFFVVLFKRQKGVQAGEYFFENKITSIQIAWRLVRGETKIAPVPVTFFEGETVAEMAERLGNALPEFDTELFLRLAQNKEGYLFPDTYFFKRKITPEEVIEILGRTFIEKTESLLPLFEESGKSIDDIVTMASIIEKEASRNFEEKKIISGILWKRIDIGMALQVDATLKYETGRGSAQLTTEDLQDDHPYNTYTNTGLPPTPIGNPGIQSLIAAAEPESSPYLFYLHGRDGAVRYGKTYDEHTANRRKYLK